MLGASSGQTRTNQNITARNLISKSIFGEECIRHGPRTPKFGIIGIGAGGPKFGDLHRTFQLQTLKIRWGLAGVLLNCVGVYYINSLPLLLFANQLLSQMMLAGPEAATRFIKFVNASPTPFHAVHNATLRLEKAGFLKVRSSVHGNISDPFYITKYHRSEKKMTGKRT